ncbi:MAG: recombination mediator RecR [Candidatus Omnitrophica bacterium]|nr:recombination mediator RecR [Candidatus Omnitrophota bacterium]
MSYPKLIESVIEQLMKLPGIGRRSAERMVFWMLNHPHEDVLAISNSLTDLKEGLRFCSRCYNFSEAELCRVCNDISRDHNTICVVEDPKDVIAIERSGVYKGVYHVLLGNIDPSEGRGPQDIQIPTLFKRIETQSIKEVIIATDPDNQGDMTALYIVQHLKNTNITLTRIGVGLPMGSSLEYADMSTLGISINSRRPMVASG